MQTLVILSMLAAVGQVAHWVVGSESRHLLVSYNKYMSTHRWHTLRAVLAIVASVIALCAASDCELSTQTMCLAFMCGYNFDSLFNKFPRS